MIPGANHFQLAEIQHASTQVDGFVEKDLSLGTADKGSVGREDGAINVIDATDSSLEPAGIPNDVNILPLSHILAQFAKARIVKQFPKVAFGTIGGQFTPERKMHVVLFRGHHIIVATVHKSLTFHCYE